MSRDETVDDVAVEGFERMGQRRGDHEGTSAHDLAEGGGHQAVNVAKCRHPGIVLGGGTGEARDPAAAIYLAQFFHHPAARTRAWSFVKEHWNELAPTPKPWGRVEVAIAPSDPRVV